MIMRSRSDGAGGRRGEELIYTAAAPVKVGSQKRGTSQEKLGSGRPPGALLLRRGVRERSGFIKNTSVTARKQMAGPVLLRPCGHSSFAFVRVRRARSLFIILSQSLPGPSPTAWGRGERQGYFIPGNKKKKEKKNSESIVVFFLLLLLLPGTFGDQVYVVRICPREGSGFAPSLCVRWGCETEGGVCVCVCVWG